MKVIRPNCRAQFTGADVEFILSVLAPKHSPSDALVRLLSDPDARDLILDDEALFHAILERGGCVSISHHLYFYVLVRHALRQAGLEDRVVADYVAELLAEFSSLRNVRQPLACDPRPMDYLVDMVAALQEVGDEERFVLRAHMGNFSLFLSGIFPRHIRFRAQRRGAPHIGYYEGLGSASYREAARHRLARKYELTQPLLILSDAFRATRVALNDLADRLIDFGPAEEVPEGLLG